MNHGSMKSPTAKRLKLPGSPGKLNVILHGLFDFDQKADGIVVYIPNMGADHMYKAGNWLAETTLKEGAVFDLDGVTETGSKANGLNPAHNLILGDVQVKANPDSYATLRFPYPPSPIQSLCRLTVSADALAGTDKSKVLGDRTSVQSATVQVLTYPFESDANLRLGNHPWEPVLEDGFVNLHVFSEPERNPTDEHLQHAFKTCMGLFSVDLSLVRPPQPANPHANGEGSLPGVHDLELEDLVHRQERIEDLGRAIKESRDLNGILDRPTAFAGNAACLGSAGH